MKKKENIVPQITSVPVSATPDVVELPKEEPVQQLPESAGLEVS